MPEKPDTPKTRRQIAFISGASRGLGKAIALSLAGNGFDIGFTYHINRDMAEEVKNTAVSLGVRCEIAHAELSDPRQTATAISALAESLGAPGVLVCNAAITLNKMILRTNEEEWDNVIGTNLTGSACLCRAAIPLMQENGGGAIILVGSRAGVAGKAGLGAYSASKAGLIGLAKSIDIEERKNKIRANVVIPGYMLTDMGMSAPVEAREQARANSLTKTFASPEDIAGFITALTGMKNTGGQVFNIDSRMLDESDFWA